LRSKITLELTSGDQKLIKALYEALYPDNINLPEGLHIRMERIGDSLLLEVESEFRLETLISTVEEMLEDIHSAIASLNVVKADA
jgi:hypothetical protein